MLQYIDIDIGSINILMQYIASQYLICIPAQEFTFPDPVTGENRMVTIDVNNQGIVFDDGQRLTRVDDDECDQAAIDTCTNSLLHDQLICANGAGLSTCNVDAEDIHTHNCKEYVSSTAAGWPDANSADAKAKCIEEGGRLMRMTSLQDVKFLSGAAGSADTDPFDMHSVCVEDSAIEGRVVKLNYDFIKL